MPKLIGQTWWMFFWRGVVALLFGVLALALPDLTLLWLVALFAAYALIGGGIAVAGAVRYRKVDDQWWLALILGLVSLAAGVIAIIHPALTALVLVLLMGANAIVTGIFDVALAIRLRKEIRGEWVLVLAGVVSIAFGVLVFLFPGAGALAMVWLISVYAMLLGILLLIAAWAARKATRDTWHHGMPEGGVAA
jgi:uncharacterized membrane protein HdeD (DUF308 family)